MSRFNFVDAVAAIMAFDGFWSHASVEQATPFEYALVGKLGTGRLQVLLPLYLSLTGGHVRAIELFPCVWMTQV